MNTLIIQVIGCSLILVEAVKINLTRKSGSNWLTPDRRLAFAAWLSTESPGCPGQWKGRAELALLFSANAVGEMGAR